MVLLQYFYFALLMLFSINLLTVVCRLDVIGLFHFSYVAYLCPCALRLVKLFHHVDIYVSKQKLNAGTLWMSKF